LWGVAIGLGAVAVVLFITAWSIYLGKRQKEQEEESVVRVSLKDLHAAYQADVIAADGRYRGRVVEFAGVVVDEPEQDAAGYTFTLHAPQAALHAPQAAAHVNRADAARFAGLKEWGAVKVRGKCLGRAERPLRGSGEYLVLLDGCVRVD
jgi:hypothetical protein